MRVHATRSATNADGGVREGGDVAELTGLLALSTWPPGMHVIVRREPPHPGAQLSLFEERDGWRYQTIATNTPERAGLLGGPASRTCGLSRNASTTGHGSATAGEYRLMSTPSSAKLKAHRCDDRLNPAVVGGSLLGSGSVVDSPDTLHGAKDR